MIRRLLLWLIDKLRGLLDPQFAAEQEAYREGRAKAEAEQAKEDEARAEARQQQARIDVERAANDSEINDALKRIEEAEHAKEKAIDDVRGKPDSDVLRGDL